jgi:hypothetical protein
MTIIYASLRAIMWRCSIEVLGLLMACRSMEI